MVGTEGSRCKITPPRLESWVRRTEHWLWSEKAEVQLWLFCLFSGILKDIIWAGSFLSCEAGTVSGWETACGHVDEGVCTWHVLHACFFLLSLSWFLSLMQAGRRGDVTRGGDTRPGWLCMDSGHQEFSGGSGRGTAGVSEAASLGCQAGPWGVTEL